MISPNHGLVVQYAFNETIGIKLQLLVIECGRNDYLQKFEF